MTVLSIVLQSLLILYYIFSGFSKVAGVKYWADIFNHLNLPGWFRVVTGIVQIIGAAALIAGFWLEGMVPWAGIWLGITMVSAFFIHVKVKDSFGKTVPPLVFVVLIAVLVIINAESLQHPFS